MKNNYKKLALAALGLSVCMASQPALSELYVSPVVRDSVKFDATEKAEDNAKASDTISGESTVHGRFMMKDTPETLSTLMRFGRNVPLFVALEKIIPGSKDWYIHVDEGLENSIVDWEGGESWEDVLRVISDQNDLHIRVNKEERSVGVSKNAKLAEHLAHPIPQVWKLDSSLTLRENLAKWSERAGWSLEWDESLTYDYPIRHGAVLTGNFVGVGGVVDQVMFSLKDSKKPLTAEFYETNNVVLVKEAGYKQEVMY